MFYERTPVKDFQAAYDPTRPLAFMSEAEQDEALKRIAIGIKSTIYD